MEKLSNKRRTWGELQQQQDHHNHHERQIEPTTRQPRNNIVIIDSSNGFRGTVSWRDSWIFSAAVGAVNPSPAHSEHHRLHCGCSFCLRILTPAHIVPGLLLWVVVLVMFYLRCSCLQVSAAKSHLLKRHSKKRMHFAFSRCSHKRRYNAE